MEKGSVRTVVAESHFEVESHDEYLRKQIKVLKMTDAARISITALALLCGVTILGLSADALSVYNMTRLGDNSWLSLWPTSFDLRPTVALIVGSSIVMLANIAALLCSKVPHLRYNTPLHTPMMFVAPLIGFAAAIIAMVFFYAINASTTVDTLISWTCRWQAVPMSQAPNFGTLCGQSWASVYLAVILIPLEAIALLVAGWQVKAEKHAAAYSRARKGSPGA
ncbi:hypothetical protein VSDG_06141 [Cytospora chrysosperma]|uniref:MARVEL domain-containing protein n=1 Tax=Cytospora chrysosperma TaxID=252740 RepID=A0A423VUG4_CYTCH|nr:hypothetical protein VSDG_06141 [Valsa sordida]